MPQQFRHWVAADVSAVWARAANGVVPWHNHAHVVLGIVDRGIRIIDLRDSCLIVPAGVGFVIPAGLSHRCRRPLTSGTDDRVICLSGDSWPRLHRAAVLDSDEWRKAFERIFASITRGESIATNHIVSLSVAAAGADVFNGGEPGAVRRVRRSLEKELSSCISLRRLSMEAGMSPMALQKLFRRTTGLTPHQHHTVLRLRRARALLLDGVAISDIAFETGFTDQSHLSRVFKSLMSVPPGQFHRQALSPSQPPPRMAD